MTGSRIALGDAGERLAERRVLELGWTILDRKWRTRDGELDLVALDQDVLVFIEVKTRRGGSRGTAEEAVDERKAVRLLALGDQYIAEHPEHGERYWRVDLIAITLSATGAIERVNHIRNAFSSG